VKSESPLKWNKERHSRRLAQQCQDYVQFDIDRAFDDLTAYKMGDSSSSNVVKSLENRWYKSLLTEPDYSVYADPYYVCDIWNCWTQYSRKYLKELANPKSYPPDGLIKLMTPMSTIVDLGCSFGYTTAALKEIWPDAKVLGTNLKDTFQFKMASQLGKEMGFTVTESTKKIGKADLVFASEYFEHFQKPINELHRVVTDLMPTFMAIANGFNGHAIGHFNVYEHRGQTFSASRMSKEFNKAMKHYGYTKIQTKIWNQRPAIWCRSK